MDGEGTKFTIPTTKYYCKYWSTYVDFLCEVHKVNYGMSNVDFIFLGQMTG